MGTFDAPDSVNSVCTGLMVAMLEEFETLLRNRTDVRRVRLKVGNRNAGAPIPVEDVDDVLLEVEQRLDDMPHGESVRLVLEGERSAYLASCTVVNEPPPSSTALDSALRGSGALDLTAVELLQAVRDQMEHNRAREKSLDERYDRLVETSVALVEATARQLAEANEGMVRMTAAALEARAEAIEARASGIGMGSNTFERTADKIVGAVLQGMALDRDIPPTLAAALGKPRMIEVLGKKETADFLQREDAADILEQLLTQLNQPEAQ